jgi:parallel beta-helix repeat protein
MDPILILLRIRLYPSPLSRENPMTRFAVAFRWPYAPPGCRNRLALQILSMLLAGFWLILPGRARADVRDSVVYYVAASGNDSWSGKRAAPNTTRTDGPFASLQHARDIVRKSLAAGLHPSVRIRQGIYRVDSTLCLDPKDSGSQERPVIWGAYADETVRFMGGVTIGSFQPIRDARISGRLPGPARASVLVTDLHRQQITDFGTPPNRMNVFFRGARMPVARFPNQGWLTIAGVPQVEEHILNPGDHKVIKEGLPAGRHSGMFQYDGSRPSGWANHRDIWMHGYWVWDWRDAYQKLGRIDTAARIVYPEPPHHHYGYQKGQRYYFLNVLEELDSPGEWVLDAEQGLLYFWPPSVIGPDDVMISLMKEPMILLDGPSHVRLQGLTFESSRACAIKIRGGSDNMIAGCTIRNIDNDTSVIIDGGRRNGIRSCDIYDIGSTGVRIVGGDRSTLTPAGNYAINNHIYRFGGILQTFNGGIYLQGVGNTVSHNRIHDAPFSGIQYYGNNHLIECNELYDLAHESGDVGGINTGGDYSEMGTVIRYNYIHDTHGYGEGGFRGIYLDLPGSNTTIVGNILANVDIGVFFNSGRDNLVENNIFFNCHPSVNIYIWPHRSYFYPGGAWKIFEKLHAIRYSEPPYSTQYPMLPRYLDSLDLGMPYANRVLRNVSAGGTWLDLSEGMNFMQVRVENNVVGDSMLLVYTRKWTPDYDPYHIGYASTHSRGDSSVARELMHRGNVLGDPVLADPRAGDFRLGDRSPAWKAGFQRIPIENIGLVADEFRRSISR